MNKIKEVCGYKDSNGKFWDTLELAERANRQLEEQKVVEKIYNLLCEPMEDGFYRSSGSRHDLIILANKMFNRPEKFLQILWEVTRYKFKKKFNDPTNKTGTE